MGGPDSGALGDHPNEMVIVVVATQLDQGQGEAVGGGLDPSLLLASPLAPWHCYWGEDRSREWLSWGPSHVLASRAGGDTVMHPPESMFWSPAPL